MKIARLISRLAQRGSSSLRRVRPSIFTNTASRYHLGRSENNPTLQRLQYSNFTIASALPVTSESPTSTTQPKAGTVDPLMEDLETSALRVVHLERCADDAHKLAQQYNKDGRFEEAKEAYAEMHRLEDEASVLTKKVGCVACVLGTPGTEETSSSCPALNLEELQRYETHYRPRPWPVQEESSATGGSSSWQDRALGCVIGSSVADAAATGVHWIYDLDALSGLQQERELLATTPGTAGLEFMDPPRSPFYSYAVGRNSPYGEQMVVLLQSLEEEEGLACLPYASAFQGAFGEGWDGYRDVSTKGFLRNMERGMLPPNTGAADAQANCVARLAPLAAAFAGDAQLMVAVECATRVTQNSDAAVAWACTGAAVLEALLLKDNRERQGEAVAQDGSTRPAGPMEGAVRGVMVELQKGVGRFSFVEPSLAITIFGCLQQCLDLASTSVPEATTILGRNCHMPNALQTPIHVVLHLESSSEAPISSSQLSFITNSSSSHNSSNNSASSSNSSSSSLPDNPVMRENFQHIGLTGPSTVQQESEMDGSQADESKQREASEARFVRAVRLAIREGGCCASRAAFVGACVGAIDGLGAVPRSWCGKHGVNEAVARGAGKLVSLRGVHTYLAAA